MMKHVWPYFLSRFPKTSSERVSSGSNSHSAPAGKMVLLFMVGVHSWKDQNVYNLRRN